MVHVTYVLIMFILLFLSAFGIATEQLVAPATASEEKVIVTKPEEKRKITVNNTIVQKDLGYYKFFMTHYPSEFTLQVNGKKLENKQQMVVDEPRLTIVYAYEWSTPLGRVKKSKTLVYDVDPKIEKIDLSFTSWKEDEPRIKAPGCSLVQVTEIEEVNTIPKDKVNQFIPPAGQK